MKEKYLNPDNIKNYCLDDWIKLIHSDFDSCKYSTNVYGRNPHVLYRARKNYDETGKLIERFETTSQLWAPPAEVKIPLGRCNLNNESIFYCSILLQGALYEINPKAGERITIMQYNVEQEIYPFSLIGHKKIAGFNHSYTQSFRDHFNGVANEIIQLDDCLAEIFITNNTNIYALTNAIFQSYTYKPITKFPQIKGLLFPSAKSHIPNFAFIPNLVKDVVKPYQAIVYEVISIDDRYINLIQLDRTDVMKGDCKLEWTNPDFQPRLNFDVLNY